MGKDTGESAEMEVETVRDEGTGEAAKAAKPDDDDKALDEDDLLLASFGDGDGFVTREEREARAAAERREKRRLRLERLSAAAQEEEETTSTQTPNKGSSKRGSDDTLASSRSSSAKKPRHEESTTDAVPLSTRMASIDASHAIHLPSRAEAAVAAASAASAENEGGPSSNSDHGNDDAHDSDHSSDSDMFGSPTSVEREKKEAKTTNSKPKPKTDHNAAATTRQDGFDDTEGYYKATIGETIRLEVPVESEDDRNNSMKAIELRVLGVIGKGVFSSVLKCSTSSGQNPAGIPTTISLGGTDDPSSSSGGGGVDLPPEVAIKCIRSNETMAKAALDETKFLLRLSKCPGIVPLLLPAGRTAAAGESRPNPHYVPPPVEFRGHTLLVFPYVPYNLRDVLQKFGRGVGLSLTAVANYFQQLLRAARHLETHKVLHADLKPDNLLVSADFGTVVLADFGSALEANSTGDAAPVTPYLVSRFYRAPEIVLGLQPLTHAIDLWSLAVTVAELFLGSVLLRGANNNDMLRAMMETLGPFSGRTIKNHLLQTKKHPGLPAHFSQVQTSTFVFRQETVDKVLGQAVHKEVSLGSSRFKPTLQSRLLKAKSAKDPRTKVMRFSDLLTKCLVLDPAKRIGVRAALKHDFFQAPKQQPPHQAS